MAIDTREDRQSSLGMLLPFQARGVEPDPGIDAAERQAAGLVYSGIAAGAPVIGIDTREDRQSALGMLLPFQARGVEPDPGIDAAERQAAGLVYSGIAAGAPVVFTWTIETVRVSSLIYRIARIVQT